MVVDENDHVPVTAYRSGFHGTIEAGVDDLEGARCPGLTRRFEGATFPYTSDTTPTESTRFEVVEFDCSQRGVFTADLVDCVPVQMAHALMPDLSGERPDRIESDGIGVLGVQVPVP